MTTQVAILAKAPIPGRVKTRLAAEVGVERALAAYRAVGERVVGQVAGVHSVCVWFDPPGAESMMRDWLGPDLEFRPQPGGDLGARLTAAFECHFRQGARRVIALGSDAPGVTAALVTAAHDALEDADVVLGPSLDGGYYLVGLRQHSPDLFRAVPWSTSRVLQITLATCVRRHLRVFLLEPLRDLDTSADLAALGLEWHP